MSLPAAPDYRDRRGALIGFGIVEILIGGLCALGIPLMLFARIVASRRPDMPASHNVIPAMAVYACMAVAFIWLGIGSILARRWARAILLCGSAVGLCAGVLGCIFAAFTLPRLWETMNERRPSLPPPALVVMEVTSATVMFVIYVLIPGALFLFYRSPHVKRTCEVLDPVQRWTDRCPLPVLAMSLMMGFGAFSMFFLMASFRGFPVFGIFVSGGTAYLVSLAAFAVLLYLAWGFYRLKIQAWWIALGLQALSLLSTAVTLWGGTDMAQIYGRMVYDPRAAAATMQLFTSPLFKVLMALSVIPWLAWLLSIRRYFAAPPSAPPLL
jgi:hypothetical protein